MDISLQIDSIAIGSKVARRWDLQEDGSLMWRKRINMIWKIEIHNECTERKSKPITTREGQPFYPQDHSVTLDDFVFLRDVYQYVHIGTGLTFNARQLNGNIFKNKATWPHRHGIGGRLNPAAWIRKFNRVEHAARFNVVRGALNVQAA